MKTKKKGLYQKMEPFFSPNSGEDQTKKMSSQKMEHFFPQIQVKTKKKGLRQKWNTFFPEFQWTPTLRCTPESNYWGGCRCRPYTQTIGGIQSNYWGDISPRGFGTPVKAATTTARLPRAIIFNAYLDKRFNV